MILYNSNSVANRRDRPIKTLNLSIEEWPERQKFELTKAKERYKFIQLVKKIVRNSPEYRAYIKFIRANMDMNRCEVLKGLRMTPGKKYTIELHHEPFSLQIICDTVLKKRETMNQSLDLYDIAEEVTELHYDGKVGLIPLSKTMHELVEAGKIFIPLQYIYQNYHTFFEEYEQFMDQSVKDMIEAKVNLSLKTDNILSDKLDVEFVYVKIDGFDFPNIPDEWKSAISLPEYTE